MGKPVSHWQVIVKDPERAAHFYKGLFGWTVDSANALGYRTVATNASIGIDGGIWPAPPEAPPMVTLYVEVDDVAAHVKRAAELGAKVVMPLQTLPDGDQMAVITDPEGIPFGLMRKKKS